MSERSKPFSYRQSKYGKVTVIAQTYGDWLKKYDSRHQSRSKYAKSIISRHAREPHKSLRELSSKKHAKPKPKPTPPIRMQGWKYDCKFSVKYVSRDHPAQNRAGYLTGTVYSPYKLTGREIYEVLSKAKAFGKWIDEVIPNRIDQYVTEQKSYVEGSRPYAKGVRFKDVTRI